MTGPAPLWRPGPERVATAAITRFVDWLGATRGLGFPDYEALWQWSVTELEAFWAAYWEFAGIRAHRPWTRVLAARVMPGARWFEGATLNYAEHLLARAASPGAASRPALVFRSEIRPRTETTWAELAAGTGALAATLGRLGVEPGDRVAAYVPNVPEAVTALLATTSLGAIWSSASPDMGPASVIDRFRQIGPRVLVAVDGYRYGGRDVDRRDTVRELVRRLPSVEAVILVPYLDPGASLEALDAGEGAARRRVPVASFAEASARPAPPRFLPVPFDHPLWIVYSSGTTGMPKPIVHGHGGLLLEMHKAGTLHLDVRPDDRLFWFSSTSWIMWNFWVSMLATGCTALHVDGNPGHPDLGTLWRFAEQERATFFGTSPAFLGLVMKAGLRPRERFDLSALRTLGCTGSPLTAEGYRWVYDAVHPDILLASISGGTDPAAAFLTSCPTLPVYAGEMQCRGLGVAVHAWDDAGQPRLDEVGELVVTRPMPSMPLRFWGDADGRRYHESYFETFPGPPNVWRHGDWLRLIPRPESVTSVIYGRSDSTINRHGIRMGTSEIYRVVEEFPEVADSLVVDLEYLGRESWMALFVVLREPAPAGGATPGPGVPPQGASVPADLRRRLLEAIRTELSARHVPDDVVAIPEVPRTISGKKLEVPVKKVLLGHPVERAVNRDSMANPGAIDWFVAFAARRAAGPA